MYIYKLYLPIKSQGHMRPCVNKYHNDNISCKFVKNVIIKEGSYIM